ncbi:MAG: FlgB family protein [Paracoccaceae bacterium]|nr:FlgB family protein [Paracoccaceae bacterium]
MFQQIDVLKMAGAMASNAEARQNAIARNIANANTPGYKAVDVASFASTYQASDGFTPNATLPGHFTSLADSPLTQVSARKKPGNESPNGNTVSLETEMVDAANVRQQHDMALAIYRSASTILRIALGVAK